MTQCQPDCKTHRSRARLHRNSFGSHTGHQQFLSEELENDPWTYRISLALITYIYARENYNKEFYLALIKWVSFIFLYKFYFSYKVPSWTKYLTWYRKIPTSQDFCPDLIKPGKQPFWELSQYLYFHLSILQIKQLLLPGVGSQISNGGKTHPFDVWLLLVIQIYGVSLGHCTLYLPS